MSRLLNPIAKTENISCKKCSSVPGIPGKTAALGSHFLLQGIFPT